MNVLEEYYRQLDESAYDCHNETDVNVGFQQIISTLIEAGSQELAEYAEIERQSILLRKSFDIIKSGHNGDQPEGLKWMVSGKRTLDDGTEEDFVWPDHHLFSEKDFEHIWSRYNATKNLYLKTEYGLVGYFAGLPIATRHRNFKLGLCDELTNLAKAYLQKALAGNTDNYYALDFLRAIKGAIHISSKENSARFSALATYLFSVHQEWDSTRRDGLRISLDIPSILLQYPKSKQIVDFSKILIKNQESALVRTQTDSWQAVYIADASLKIQQKTKLSVGFDWLRFKAEQYEILAEEAKTRSGFGALSLYEDTLAIYNQLGDTHKINEVSERYKALRGIPDIAPISQEIPRELVQTIVDEIKRIAVEETPEVIFNELMFGRTFNTLKGLRESEEVLRENSVLLKMMPITVYDKYGNPAAHYGINDEYGTIFWQTYDYDFQLGSQNLTLLFWQAYRAQKVTFETTKTFLENSWLNEPIARLYGGQSIQVKPIEIVLPPIKKMFEEFDAYFANEKHEINLTVVVDSLTLKVEAIIRYLFDKTGEKTFKHNAKRGVMQEKNLDELLSELRPTSDELLANDEQRYFSEEDRLFIRYVMTEKIGLNLRNRVAHGLLDSYEYHFEASKWLILVFSIVIRLCKYQFEQIHGSDNK